MTNISRKNRSRKQKTQKIYKMKGCSRKRMMMGGCGCATNMVGGKSKSKSGPAYLDTCKVCGSGCRCTPGCRCHPKCPGNCYLKDKRNSTKRNKIGGCGCDAPMGQTGGNNPYWVGGPWTPSISTWPGVQGEDGVTNHYKPYDISKDPTRQMQSERDWGIFPSPVWKGCGGKSKKRLHLKKNLKGGGWIPQDLVNLGRNIMYDIGSTYNALTGYPQPVDPMPYKDQLVKK